MTEEPDLFTAAEPKTCGNCGACISGTMGTFCDLSCKAIQGEGEACAWWYARAEG